MSFTKERLCHPNLGKFFDILECYDIVSGENVKGIDGHEEFFSSVHNIYTQKCVVPFIPIVWKIIYKNFPHIMNQKTLTRYDEIVAHNTITDYLFNDILEQSNYAPIYCAFINCDSYLLEYCSMLLKPEVWKVHIYDFLNVLSPNSHLELFLDSLQKLKLFTDKDSYDNLFIDEFSATKLYTFLNMLAQNSRNKCMEFLRDERVIYSLLKENYLFSLLSSLNVSILDVLKCHSYELILYVVQYLYICKDGKADDIMHIITNFIDASQLVDSLWYFLFEFPFLMVESDKYEQVIGCYLRCIQTCDDEKKEIWFEKTFSYLFRDNKIVSLREFVNKCSEFGILPRADWIRNLRGKHGIIKELKCKLIGYI